MSRCYLIFEDGELICTVEHRNYKNCDLTKAEELVVNEVVKPDAYPRNNNNGPMGAF